MTNQAFDDAVRDATIHSAACATILQLMMRDPAVRAASRNVMPEAVIDEHVAKFFAAHTTSKMLLQKVPA